MKSGFERDTRHGKNKADEVCERQRQGREGPGRHIGYNLYRTPTGGKQAQTHNDFHFLQCCVLHITSCHLCDFTWFSRQPCEADIHLSLSVVSITKSPRQGIPKTQKFIWLAVLKVGKSRTWHQHLLDIWLSLLTASQCVRGPHTGLHRAWIPRRDSSSVSVEAGEQEPQNVSRNQANR